MPPPRPWHYWSENKLIILADYLPAFTIASKKAGQTIYLDLFAGRAENVSSTTGEPLDGSPVIALKTQPQLTHIHLFEQPNIARALERKLRQDFPDRQFTVHAGDCNDLLPGVLRDLAPHSNAPTFAFIDQQGAEVKWTTLASIASFRPANRTKAEMWLYWSPAAIGRGVRGTNGPQFAEQVDKMYGTSAWRDIQRARDEDLIDPERYRLEMTNLIRWRLEKELHYRRTYVLEMRMRGLADVIYVLVFATDHHAGEKIMSYLYRRAMEREPRMREVARARKLQTSTGQDGLFEISPEMMQRPVQVPTRPPRHAPPWRPPTYDEIKTPRRS